MPRSLKSSQKSRHDPLLRDIAADDLYAKYGNVSKPGRRKKTQHDEDGSGEVTLYLSLSPRQLYCLLPSPHFSDYIRSKNLQTHL